MKDLTFETQLIAATPKYSDNQFVKSVMTKIKNDNPQKNSFKFWLTHLHKPAMALLLLAAITLISGVVYAAISFAPGLIEILGKKTSDRGTAEYSVSGFNDCASNGSLNAEMFEVNSYAPKISDDDFKKIIQAKCELHWLEDFVNQTWKTYGTHLEWQDGDKIFYTRLDTLGTVKQVNATNLTLEYLYGDPRTYNSFGNEPVKAYFKSTEIPIDQIKPGDTTFSIVRVSETYHDMHKQMSQSDKTVYLPNNDPQMLGLVAVFKMSLPLQYYQEMQGYINEIPKCMGNEHEYCPSTGSIDIYPREGGEGATNPYLKRNDEDVMKQISGTVTELNASDITIKSRAGENYKFSVGDNGFEVYNHDYANNYTNIDSKLKIGSNVQVTYYQKPQDTSKIISKEQTFRVTLMIESLNFKTAPTKQY